MRVADAIKEGAAHDFETEPKALLEDAESALFALAETGQREVGFVPFEDALEEAVALAAEAYARTGEVAGLSTGLVDLDQRLGGLHPSDLLIVAGRPSMGKTALATNIGFHVARAYAFEPQPDGSRKTVRGGVVGFYSLEMSKAQLAARILAEVSGVPSDRVRRGDIDQAEFARYRDAKAEIAAAPLYIDATGGISIGKLAARARRLKRRHGLDLLIVDYLQLMTVDASRSGRRDNRVQEVTEITQGLKALAKELNVPVLALSQLSRQVEQREDKRPQLSDLRESGSIEQDADAVMFVYREAYYLARTEPKGGTPEHLAWEDQMAACRRLAEVIIGKQRHGPIGTVRLAFDEDLTKFGNLASDDRYVDFRRPSRKADRGPAPATPRTAEPSARLPYGADE
jgi:replicative DNA helicase